MEAYTLYELNEFVRRIVALNFADAIWVRAEISQYNISRGHHYIAVLQKEEEGQIIAEADAVIWKFQYAKLSAKAEVPLSEILKPGREVMLKVKPEFHERYGYKLTVVDINAAFTIGKLALQRQKVVSALEKEQLLNLNGELPLPLAFKRLAVISTENAAGYQDFRQQLLENNLGYTFDIQLFTTSMQGENTVIEALKNLKKVRRHLMPYDALLIIRGGGAKLSLSAFDDLELCKAIAKFPIPVLTGIGHHRDESVLDKVSHTALKTPTAVADFLLQHNFTFESKLQFLAQNIQEKIQNHLGFQVVAIKNISHDLFRLSMVKIAAQHQIVDNIEKNIPSLVQRKLITEERKLSHLSELNNILSTANTLKRGYTLTSQKGNIISSAKKLKKGAEILTHFKDGEVKSKVNA